MLDISELLKLETQEKDIDVELNIKSVKLMYDEIKFNKPLKLIGTIKNVSKIVKLEGKINLTFDIMCFTCGENFVYNDIIEISEVFMQNPTEENYPILAEKIDIEQAVIDNIIIKLPTKFLCKEGCKGICPICMKNKNIYNCNCTDFEIDPRFEKLRQLLNKDNIKGGN